MSPTAASSPLSCSRVTPGSTTATWFSVSISRIRFMRSKASKMPSATGTAAPERPVPLPRATTGTLCSLASRRTSDTSSVDPGSTRARGTTGTVVSASSWV